MYSKPHYKRIPLVGHKIHSSEVSCIYTMRLFPAVKIPAYSGQDFIPACVSSHL